MNEKLLRWFFLALLIAATGFGAVSSGLLAFNEIRSGNICPTLGPVPLCYVVFAGYAAMFLAASFGVARYRRAFSFGLAPVFALAAVGVVSELIIGDICPQTPAGVPQCFISLGLICLIFVLWAVLLKGRHGLLRRGRGIGE